MNFVQVCNKGNMLLQVDKTTREFQLTYSMTDLKRLNIDEFLSFKIYDLMARLNQDLIEDIQIIKIYNDDEIDVFFKFKNIAKELGMQQRCILLKTVRIIDKSDPNNIKIEFRSKSINKEDTDINFFKTIDLTKYSILQCKFANSFITIQDINIAMKYNFLILMNEELPQYMENMIGLMMKKIFYNVKKFVDKIEEK
tara:strand:- start:203 stop:793 length:591 start_codon:yes stop_codon:yes gene_type:complete